MKNGFLKITGIFFILFAFSAQIGLSSEERSSASVESEEFDFANGLFSRGMYDMAIKGYESFLRNYPESRFSETAFFRIGESYYLSKQYDKAISDYKDFISTFPSSELRYNSDLRIAQILLAKKEYKDAEKILLRLIGLRPSPEITVASEYYLGLVYLESKRYEQAKNVFKGITDKKADPRYLTFAYISLGEIFLEEGEDSAASSSFSSAVESADNDALREKISLRAGEVHFSQGKYKEAGRFYKMIIDAPNDPVIFDAAVIGYLSSLHSGKEFALLIEEAEKFLSKVNTDEIKAQILFIIGNRYFNSDDYPAAHKAYSEAANLYPNTDFGVLARLNDSWALYKLGEYEQCIAGVESYIKKDVQRKDEAMYIKARVYSDLEDFDKALQVYNDLERQYPGSEFKKEAMHQKAWIYEETGENENALKTYLNFALDYPEDDRSPSMIVKAAQVNYQLKKFDKAIEGYLMFLEKYPENVLKERALYQLGNIYLEKNLTEEGIRIFEMFLEEFKASEAREYVLFSLGRAYQNQGQWDKAIEKYNVVAADKMSLRDKDIYFSSLESIAFCYFKKGNKEKAAEGYLKLMLLAEETKVPEGVFLWVADYFLSIRDTDKSLSVLKVLEKGYPRLDNPGDMKYLFAQNYMEQGEIEDAIRYFEQAISEGAGSPYRERAFLGLGQAYYRKGVYDKALVYLERAMDENKDEKTNAFVRFEIGNVYFKQRSFEEAAKQYMMVAILYDEKNLCSTALFQAGVSFREAGKDAESAEAFNELIQRYPDTSSAAKAKSYIR